MSSVDGCGPNQVRWNNPNNENEYVCEDVKIRQGSTALASPFIPMPQDAPATLLKQLDNGGDSGKPQVPFPLQAPNKNLPGLELRQGSFRAGSKPIRYVNLKTNDSNAAQAYDLIKKMGLVPVLGFNGQVVFMAQKDAIQYKEACLKSGQSSPILTEDTKLFPGGKLPEKYIAYQKIEKKVETIARAALEAVKKAAEEKVKAAIRTSPPTGGAVFGRVPPKVAGAPSPKKP